MKSHVAPTGSLKKRIKTECRREIYAQNERYHDIFDAAILYSLHRHPMLRFGKKRLRYVYEAVHQAYEELKETYCADNEDLPDLIKYRMQEELNIDLEKWREGNFD